MTHDIPSQQVEVEQLTDRIARWIESHDRFDCKSGDTYTAAARAIAEDLVSALVPKPEGETVTDDGAQESIGYAERLAYEERILAAEMQLGAAQRALTPLATRACGWEQNHPGFHGTNSTQISHRLGDFRAARTTLTNIDKYFEESGREG